MNFSDLKGNYKQIQLIQDFLINDSETLLIIGDDSTGKTSILKILQNKDNNEILILNDHNFSEIIIENFVMCKTITSFFNKNKTKLIFFDDIDTFLSIQKSQITLLHKLKSKCKMIFTIKSKEERKLNTLWKKFFDTKIYLNKLNHKECLQVVLSKLHVTHDDDDIDYDLLLELIKVHECNITNIMMLKDSVIILDNTCAQNVADNTKDLFDTNLYDTVQRLFSEDLSDRYIETISSKDSSLLSTMVHENLTQTKIPLCNYISIYDTLCYCDIMDKFIFVNCLWGINWVCINTYRYVKLNKSLTSHTFLDKKTKIMFSQQFTKLSAQVNMKKKIRSLGLNYYHNNFIDILYYLHKHNKKCNDKIINDLIKKFTKDFEL